MSRIAPLPRDLAPSALRALFQAPQQPSVDSRCFVDLAPQCPQLGLCPSLRGGCIDGQAAGNLLSLFKLRKTPRHHRIGATLFQLPDLLLRLGKFPYEPINLGLEFGEVPGTPHGRLCA